MRTTINETYQVKSVQHADDQSTGIYSISFLPSPILNSRRLATCNNDSTQSDEGLIEVINVASGTASNYAGWDGQTTGITRRIVNCRRGWSR